MDIALFDELFIRIRGIMGNILLCTWILLGLFKGSESKLTSKPHTSDPGLDSWHGPVLLPTESKSQSVHGPCDLSQMWISRFVHYCAFHINSICRNLSKTKFTSHVIQLENLGWAKFRIYRFQLCVRVRVCVRVTLSLKANLWEVLPACPGTPATSRGRRAEPRVYLNLLLGVLR